MQNPKPAFAEAEAEAELELKLEAGTEQSFLKPSAEATAALPVKIVDIAGHVQLGNRFFHVTLLSNFLKAFDKYSSRYDKSKIGESRYPSWFFLLRAQSLHVGITKASGLLAKYGKVGDRLVVIETRLPEGCVKHNDVTGTGLGEYVEHNWIEVSRLYYWADDALSPVRVEDAIAEAYGIEDATFADFASLRPRSISILPVAKGCQAACEFCFSTSSISSDQDQFTLSDEEVENVLIQAKASGAERAVITGGGEPGLLKPERLRKLLQLCSRYFSKVVLISNGHFIARHKEPAKLLASLVEAGLSVLAVSRHHFDEQSNTRIMNLETNAARISAACEQVRQSAPHLQLRWICVLQKGGVESAASIQAYLDWAFASAATQVCFKELYVSSSSESLYFDRRSNDWSYQNQVPLQLLTALAQEQAWEPVGKLPWGSPVYRIKRGDKSLTVAAYTEPSVSWERKNAQCRSWNLLANGDCFASLETRRSILSLGKNVPKKTSPKKRPSKKQLNKNNKLKEGS